MRLGWGLLLSALAVTTSLHAQENDASLLRGSLAYAPDPGYDAPLYQPAQPFIAEVSAELGARYWHSASRVQKDLFDDPRSSSSMNSRLTYSGMRSEAGEVFGAVSHANGAFFRGFVGIGATLRGSLKDEDFPPGIDTYSSTQSLQKDGHLHYVTLDAGYNFVQTPFFKLGGFIGYNHLNETQHAYGCAQNAGNAEVCGDAIPTDVKVISEDSTWRSLRVGIAGELTLFGRLKVAGNAAWVPYTTLSTRDTHWLRVGNYGGAFTGSIPQFGTGDGVQLETVVSYAVTERLTVGVGARYWRMQTKGRADLEQTVLGFPEPVSQPLHFRTERFGAFVQAGYRFGAL